MAGSVETKLPQQYVDFDEYIDFQVQKTRASIRLTDVLTAVAGVATFIVAYLIVFSLLDHWVIEGGFSPFARGVMFAAVFSLSGAWLVWKAVIPGLRTVNRLFAAREIERSTPQLKSNLINLVDLQHAGREVSESIQSAMEKRAAVALSQVNVDHVVDRRLLMRLSYALLATVIVLCAYTLFSPKQISLARALIPFSREGVATQTEIVDVKPGDAEVLLRAQLEVTADLRGEIPEEVQILFTTADRRYVDQPVRMAPTEDDSKRFHGKIIGENGQGILQDLSYRVVAGDASSQEFHVSVLQPPSAEIKQIRYDYPEYTGLEPRTRSSGHIDALEGTKVTLTATANTPVRSASIEFADERGTSFAAETVSMSITSGTQLRAEWVLKIDQGVAPQFYRIRVVGKNGATDPNPLRYNIVIRPDFPPEAAVLDPTRDIEMPANGVVPILARAQDPDFAIKEVRLRIEKSGEIINRADPPVFDGNKRSVVIKHDLKLSSLALQPGDVITYWIEARDNKAPYANAASSQRLNIRIGGPVPNEQVADQLKADHERQEKKVKDAEQQQPQPGKQGDPSDQPDEKAQEGQQPPETQQQQPQPGAEGEKSQDPSAAEKGKEGDSENQRSTNSGKSESKPGDKQDGNPQEKGDKGEKPGESKSKDPSTTDPTSEADDEKTLEKILNQYRDKGDQKKDDAGSHDENKEPQPGAEKKREPGKSKRSNDAGSEPNREEPQPNPSQDKKTEQGGADQNPSDDHKDDKPTPKNSGKQDPGKQKSDKQESDRDDPGKQDPDKQDAGKQDADKHESEKQDPGKQNPGDEAPKENDPKQKGRDDGPRDKAPSQGQQDDHSDKERKPDTEDKPGDDKTNEPGKKNAAEEQDKTDPDKQNKNAAKQPTADDKKAPSGDGKKEQSPPGGEQGDPSKGTKNQTDSSDSPKSKAQADKNDPTQPAPKNDDSAKDELKSGDSKPKDTEPADDADNATEKKARGDEKGTGTPEKNPKTEPKPSQGDVKRKEGAEKGATQPGEDDDRKKPDVKDPSKQPSPGDAKSDPKAADNDKADSDPAASPKQGDPKQPTEKGSPKETDKQSPDGKSDKSPSNKKPTDPKQPQPDSQSPKSSDKQSPPGAPGEKGDETSEAGGKSEAAPSPDDKATSQDGKKSDGPQQDQQQKQSDKGQPGAKGDSESKNGGGEGKSKDGGEKKEGGSAGSATKSEGTGKPGSRGGGGAAGEGSDRPKGGGGDGLGKAAGKGEEGTGDEGSKPGSADSDEANLESARKATDLVLKQLQKELERGEVDESWMKKNGWTKDALQKFADRLQRQLDAPADNSPQAQARRRQFEEMLKNLNIAPPGRERKGNKQFDRETEGIGPRRIEAPPEYREWFEAYTQEMSKRQKSQPAKAPTKAQEK